jgi:hypothetical protein
MLFMLKFLTFSPNSGQVMRIKYEIHAFLLLPGCFIEKDSASLMSFFVCLFLFRER